MADIKKFESALDQMIKLMVDMKQSLRDDTDGTTVQAAAVQTTQEPDYGNFDQLKVALQSDKWPEAVNPNLICDPHSEEDKKERARGVIELMIEEDMTDLKFLDFGCGEGHCADISTEYGTTTSVGYDIIESKHWGDIPQKDNLVLTKSWQSVKDNGPYNVVVLFDVIDHLKKQTGDQVLSLIKSVLADDGKIYMRCHPFTSRHATHLYHDLNKAYIHLVFTDEEIKELVPNSEFFEDSTRVIAPLRTYGEFIEKAGLKTINRRDITEKVEPFFKIPKIAERIMQRTNFKSFPEFQMGLQFIDYVLGN